MSTANDREALIADLEKKSGGSIRIKKESQAEKTNSNRV